MALSSEEKIAGGRAYWVDQRSPNASFYPFPHGIAWKKRLLEEGRTELARVAQTLPYTPSPIALPPKKRLLAEGRTELTRETPTFS